MAVFRVNRATQQDVDVLRRLSAEAAGDRASLASVRRERVDPGEWVTARAPVVVVSDGPEPVGFAAAAPQNIPAAAARCAELLVYVTPSKRRRGASRAALSELMAAARTMGLWKMVSYALPGDAAGRALLGKFDFRDVGVLVKHVQIEGAWQDLLLFERLVMAARKSFPSFSDA